MTEPEATRPDRTIAIVGGRGSDDVTGEMAVPTQPTAAVSGPDPTRTMVLPAVLAPDPGPDPGPERPAPGARRALWPLAAGVAAAVVLVAVALASSGDGPSIDLVPTTTSSTVGAVADAGATSVQGERERQEAPITTEAPPTTVPTSAPVVTEPVDDGFPEGFPFEDDGPPGAGKKDKDGDDGA